MKSLDKILLHKYVFVDEWGIEEEVERVCGRSLKGVRIYDDTSGKKTHNRMSIIAAYTQKKMIVPLRFKGYTNTDVFDTWVETCLVPVFEKGQTMILNNATFHKSSTTRHKIEAVGAELLFLPLYFPDMNKIESQWAVLKSKLRKAKYTHKRFLDNIDHQLFLMGN